LFAEHPMWPPVRRWWLLLQGPSSIKAMSLFKSRNPKSAARYPKG